MLHAPWQTQTPEGTRAGHLTSAGGVATFHKDMSIIAALGLHSGARAVFEQHGMSCSLCMGASSETIETGAIMHSVDPADVVSELNQLAASAAE